MDCKRAQTILSTYLDKKLSERDKDLVELHLRDCEDCRAFLADLKDTIKLTGSLKPAQPPAHLLEDIEKEIAKLPARKTFFDLPLWLRVPVEVAGTAAVLVLVLLVTRSLVLREFAAQPKNDVVSRWMTGTDKVSEPAPPSSVGAPSAPSEQSQELYDNVVAKVNNAYKDMGITPSQTESGATAKEEAAGDSEGKAKKGNEEPVAWEKEISAPKTAPMVAKARSAESMFGNQEEIIAPEYNINVELNDLSKGVNELTAQVYNFNGTFIGQPEPANEKSTHKEMNFKIPRDKYYQFIWNMEKIGTVKKITPIGGDKPNIVEAITVHLSIDLVSNK